MLAVPFAEKFEVSEPLAERKAEPVALPEKVPDTEPVPGMNVLAVPEAEKFDVRVPVAGSNAVPVAEPLKVAVS